MRVLALDPGERVGWATGEVVDKAKQVSRPCYDQCMGDSDVIETVEFKELTVTGHGMAYLKDMATAVYRAIVLEKKYDAVVVESWRLTPKGARVLIGSDMQWCQFIGMVRLCCWLTDTKYVSQPPAAMRSARKSATGQPCGADVLERVARADAVAHDDGHDGSALLHLWHYYFEEFV